MLNKEEMLSLIEAAESWERINDHVKDLTDGYAITNPEYTKIDNIFDIIKSNSKYPGTDDLSCDSFNDIILNPERSAEEKYDLLVLQSIM